MSKWKLPEPALARPPPAIDPFARRDAYVRMLAEIHYAEKGALGMFETLGDPSVVENASLFLTMREKLMREEEAHMRDFEDLLRALGSDGIPEPLPESRRFQDAYRGWKGYVLPVRASVAALLFLASEGNGYAVLWSLARATADRGIRERLLANVADETGHLKVSMHVLASALELEGSRAIGRLVAQMLRFIAEARPAVDANRATVEALGFDFYDLVGSSYRFLADILLQSAEAAGLHLSPAARRYLDWGLDRFCSPSGMRWASAAYVPPPAWVRPAVTAWDRLERFF